MVNGKQRSDVTVPEDIHEQYSNVVPYAMVEAMVSKLDSVSANYAFYPVSAEAHRLQDIIESEFDGRSVMEHSPDFCFIVQKLAELTISE